MNRTLLIIISALLASSAGPLCAETSFLLSKNLTSSAWDALSAGRPEEAHGYADRCIGLFSAEARKMQDSLPGYPAKEAACDYWALNDVATCLFLKGKAYYVTGEDEKALAAFREILDRYGYAQCWDPRGWFWKVADAARDHIVLMDCGLDFGDYASQTLTAKAWDALSAGRYDEAIVFARRCVNLYRGQARDMQAKLQEYPGKNQAFDFWALNDVGTCFFIIGEASAAKQDFSKAEEAYRALVEDFKYAQCWDGNGQFFWKPAEQAGATLESLKDIKK
jgi:tetratricopeptide (TPR) repeat protein